MPKTYYRTGRYKPDPSAYSGTICSTDYYTNYTNGNAVKRIIKDLNFDKWCRYISTHTKSTNRRKMKNDEIQRQENPDND